MLLEWRDQDNVEKGRREGRGEGRKEGIAETTEGLTKLVGALLDRGRTVDIAKVVADPKERARLAAELGIELPTA